MDYKLSYKLVANSVYGQMGAKTGLSITINLRLVLHL